MSTQVIDLTDANYRFYHSGTALIKSCDDAPYRTILGDSMRNRSKNEDSERDRL